MLSLYIDGQLDEESKKEFEEYLDDHSEAKKEMEQWKKLRTLLRAKEEITPNEWFSQKVYLRIEQEGKKRQTFFPFPHRYVPVAAALTLVIAGFIGVFLFQQRSSLTKYIFDKKQEVHQIYQNNILQGKLFPLFTNLDKDQVLQFALFGTLPLDAQANTALRVDENKEDGARIEFVKNEAPRHRNVTVDQFYKEVGVTPAQHRAVDSILSSARDQIQKSVFLGDNKSLAVHADLAKFNRTMMSHIVASLEAGQRKKFRKFLVASRSPYTFVAAPAEPSFPPNAIAEAPSAPRMEQFVVITPESCVIARLKIGLEDIQRNVDMNAGEVRALDERAQALMRDIANHRRIAKAPNPMLSVYSDSDYFSIKVGNSALDQSRDMTPFEIVTRAPGALQFRYQMRRIQDAQRYFDQSAQPSERVFPSGAPLPPGEFEQGNATSGRTLDLDSIISAPRDRKSQAKINPAKKRHPNPFEL